MNREPMTSEPGNEESIRLRTGPSLVIWELLIRTERGVSTGRPVLCPHYRFLRAGSVSVVKPERRAQDEGEH